MKKLLIVAGCAFVAFLESCTGCKEIGPSVNLTPDKVAAKDYDSVYTLTGAELTSLKADPHNVLVEEFTGQSCLNCPSAHRTLEDISNKYPGRINIVGLYLYNINQAIPPEDFVYDLRDTVATEIGNTVFSGIGGLPSGGIDRVLGNGSTIIENSRTKWSGTIDDRLKAPTPVNLALTSSFDTATQLAKIVVKVTYLESVTMKQNLSVVITEDGIVDKQEFPDGIHDEYDFTNVFRGMVSTAPSGAPVMDSITTKTRGMVLNRTYFYKLKTKTPAIVPKNCHVIAFIAGTETDKRIIQSVQTKLIP